MQENKNLVQEALIQMRNVEEAIAQNAKGILASTMKEEINQLVKESLSEQDMEDEVELDTDIDMDVPVDNEDDMEMDMDFDMDMDMDSEESPIDLTDASDEEILKVFKAMGEEDGIIVKKDGDDIHLSDTDTDSEYLVKLGESEEDEEELDETMIDEIDEMDVDTEDVINAIFSKDGDVEDIDMDQDEEVMYEIEFDEEDDMMEEEDDMMEEEDDMMEEEDDMMEEEDDMMEEEDDMMEEEEEEELDESYNHRRAVREGKSTVKPKGVGIGSGPKFTYNGKTAGGFKEDKKEGPKTMGTGKPKFEYKKGENMEQKSKVVKAETKEGQGYKDKEDERLAMKHGKMASKDLKTTRARRDDAGFEKRETKEGQGYKDKEDERLAMKHGKMASKDLKTTRARRDDAGFEKRETKEAARTYGMGSKEGRGLRKGITNNRNYVYGKNGVKVESTESEVNMLREKNEEYRKALNVFREKLNEVAIFNSNLAYATRLFTEHSTTKKEKINILRRFDNVDTLKESKNLYRSIKDELSKPESAPMNESVEAKLNKNVSTGSSTTLIESKTYENPQFLRMKDLMSKIG
jgi:hypothetical protein